ncbi:MAG: CrcB family protein [Gammaproteobacteria bacterium]|nr:CrcB family protein [Gammaproteobacteria bacterium]
MTSINSLLCITAGGALGALARFGVYREVLALTGASFPVATLFVNALGSFVAGVLVVCCAQRWPDNLLLQAFGLVGFLGAFTTFSTFSLDTLALLQTAGVWKALLNIGLNVGLSLGCCAVGMQVVR